MEKTEFALLRKRLKKTQKQVAQLLGISLKAIHSYEQGWRRIPSHAERSILFLAAMKTTSGNSERMCWNLKKCAKERREKCPAWEFRTGNLCWYLGGTICSGDAFRDWDEKMNLCRTCDVFQNLF